jgi:hypothetical protein
MNPETAGCPAPEEFAALAVGELAATRAAEVEAHAAECPVCAVELELAREFVTGTGGDREAATERDVASIVAALERTAVPPGATVDGARRAENVVPFGRRRPTPASPASWRRWSAPLAAAAALTLAAGLFWQTRGTPSGPGLPPPEDGGPTRSGVVLLAPTGDQPAPGTLVFRWRPAPGAAAYRVEVLDVTGRKLWSAQVAVAEATAPPAVRESLATRVRYQWAVTALDARSQPFARSEFTTFRFLPSASSETQP